MSTRTRTRTSTVKSTQRTLQRSQQGPKPFNKRPAKSDHVQATPAKVRKLSRSDTAPRRVSVDTPAKILASALKRRQQSLALGKAPPAVVVPTKRSPGKVRFLGEELMQGDPVPPGEQTQGSTLPPGNTVHVVVQRPLRHGTGDKTSNSPKRKIDTVTDDKDADKTDIVTTHFERPQNPITDPDADFRTRYLEIKSLAWTWVQNYFSDISPPAQRSLDLLHLAHTSPQLMEYVNWISCCGQKRTWEDVFNGQRALLVYGMLGKMLEVHVFGHEMFGADGEQVRELRELDMELVNRDGFYRQRCRAHKILAYLPDPTTPPPNFHHSLTALHASCIQLLSPLLPPSPLPPQLHPQLLTILLKAATLSLAMRRERKVAYHWEPHPAVGTLFEDKSMHILNESEHREESNWCRNTDLEVVTMAGWPGCVAYRPDADDGKKGKGKGKGKEKEKEDKGGRHKLGINRIARAEVCVTFGSAIKPLSVEPENWLGKRLRVEMTEREAARKAKDRSAAVARKVAGIGLAGVGVAVSAMLGLRYVDENPWVRDKVVGY